MSIQRAEQLKRDWTDQFVVVQKGVPELRRFDGFVGQVKTVNMNCRLLIQFETPADISWYDIDPQFVSVVDRPDRNPQAETETEPLPSAAPKVKAAAAAAVTKPPSSDSPLDIIRKQSAAKSSGAKQSGRPLDRIQALAADSRDTAAAKEPADSSSVATPAGGSPLDQIRAQAAKKLSAIPATAAPLPVDSAPASPVSSDASGAALPAATVESFRVGTASTSADSGTDKSITDTVPGKSKETADVQAATDIRIPSLVDQIRAQATDDETPGSQSTLFEQIRRQAAEPQA